MAEAVTLAAVKAYLRIETGDEDALLRRLIATATEACEMFVGKVVLVRAIEEDMAVSRWWMRLDEMPVTAITGVAEITGDTARPLAITDYAIDIPPGGAGMVRVATHGLRLIRVAYRAGLAETVEQVPAGLAQGIIRYVSHLYCYRDGADEPGLPMAVTNLWQAYKTMRLGGGPR